MVNNKELRNLIQYASSSLGEFDQKIKILNNIVTLEEFIESKCREWITKCENKIPIIMNNDEVNKTNEVIEELKYQEEKLAELIKQCDDEPHENKIIYISYLVNLGGLIKSFENIWNTVSSVAYIIGK